MIATAFFAVPSRQRMVVLATSAALYILVDSGFNVIGPLWATRDLGLDNAGWAFLRSAVELGGLVSVLAFNVLSERIGTRRMSAIALGGAGLTLAALSTGAATVWLMAILGAFISTIYVNFNTLAQRVSARKQSLANAIYRASGASAAIVAPTLATQAAHATGAYAPVLVAAAVLLGVAAFVILWYAEPSRSDPPRALAAVLASYRRTFTLRPLLSFVAISRGFGIAIAAVSAFAALRFTRELHLSETAFGVLCSAIAVGSLLALIGSGWIVDRLRPSRALGFAWLGCSVAAMIMGLTSSLAIAIAAYALFVPLLATCSVPLSLWSSRIADDTGAGGPSQSTVFAAGKVFQSGTTMLVMALLGVLEPLVGMDTLMWCGGLLGLPLAFIVMRLGKPRAIQVAQIMYSCAATRTIPMRSKLFVPGSRPELFAKALASEADALSIDLEDSVVDARKAEARSFVGKFLQSPEVQSSRKVLIVRVNALGTPHLEADLLAIAPLRPAMVNLPKVESPDEVRACLATLDRASVTSGARQETRILANIETPKGLRRAAEIAAAHPRVAGLQLGYLDLFGPAGIERRDAANVHAAMFAVRMAAAEAGVFAYDGAFSDVQDEHGFRAEAELARRLGFLGKSCIHPRQILLANEVFRPSEAEIAHALRVVEASRHAMAQGVGAFTVDGKMIDGPAIRRAEAIVEISRHMQSSL